MNELQLYCGKREVNKVPGLRLLETILKAEEANLRAAFQIAVGEK